MTEENLLCVLRPVLSAKAEGWSLSIVENWSLARVTTGKIKTLKRSDSEDSNDRSKLGTGYQFQRQERRCAEDQGALRNLMQPSVTFIIFLVGVCCDTGRLTSRSTSYLSCSPFWFQCLPESPETRTAADFRTGKLGPGD